MRYFTLIIILFLLSITTIAQPKNRTGVPTVVGLTQVLRMSITEYKDSSVSFYVCSSTGWKIKYSADSTESRKMNFTIVDIYDKSIITEGCITGRPGNQETNSFILKSGIVPVVIDMELEPYY